MASYPTLHEVRGAAEAYWEMWQKLLNEAPELRQAIGQHSPTSMGWKVEGDIAPLEAAERLFELGDSAYVGPVNGERSILTIRKAQAMALDTLAEIKLLQRRPSRPEDRLGADSLDFYVPHGLPDVGSVTEACGDVGAKCEAEHNAVHKWISIRYQDHEFKLTDHTVWEVCVEEAAALAGVEIKRP
jgi:hypothetical protein